MEKDELKIVTNNHTTSGEVNFLVSTSRKHTYCSSGYRLPDFLGIGTQKGGTTTLHRLLAAHPAIMIPQSKELHYFTLNYRLGSAWYAGQFQEADNEQLCGEITPYYLFHPHAPQRIQAMLPRARLIVLLRDPVERALSQYFHSRRLGLEPLELEAALSAEELRLRGAHSVLAGDGGRHKPHQENSYQARSRYEQQLPLFEHYFSRKQLLVIRSEDLFREPRQVWRRVVDFLKLDLIPLPALQRPANAGAGESTAVPQRLREQLRLDLQPTYAWAKESLAMEWEG